MKLVRESIATGSSLIYLITPPPNLASQRRQRFRGKPFVNLLRVYSRRRRIHENVECTSAEERERDRQRERDCVPVIRTRDRPIIDVPYRCVALGITSTKTVPSRTSTGFPFPLSTFLSSLPVDSPVRSCFPTDRQQPPLWSAPNFSRLFIARKPFSRQNIHKTGPFRAIRGPRFQAAPVALPSLPPPRSSRFFRLVPPR